MDQLEVTVVARGGSGHRLVQMRAPMPDREIYHEVISDRNFVQYAHRTISGLEEVVPGDDSFRPQWYTFSLRFLTDGKTMLVYSGESNGSTWTLDDMVSTRTVKTMDDRPASDVMWILKSCYSMPDFRIPHNETRAKAPDEYLATCQIQSALEYPSPRHTAGAQGQIVVEANPYYRLMYFANLVTPDGRTYTVTGGTVEVRGEPGDYSHRDPHPCHAPELEAERAAVRERLVQIILAEGWEQISENQFGLSKRRSIFGTDERYAICQIEPNYFARRDLSREDEGYEYYELGFRAHGIRPNLEVFDLAWRSVDMHGDFYRVERGMRPDGIQHPWDICVEEQIAAWDDLIKEMLADGWEQINGVGKFRMPVVESYKYPMSWSQNRAKKW
jgi:hypothetical protein